MKQEIEVKKVGDKIAVITKNIELQGPQKEQIGIRESHDLYSMEKIDEIVAQLKGQLATAENNKKATHDKIAEAVKGYNKREEDKLKAQMELNKKVAAYSEYHNLLEAVTNIEDAEKEINDQIKLLESWKI